MAVNIFELFGTIGADDKPATNAIDKVVGHAKQADHTLSNGLNKIGSFATGVGNKLSLGLTTPVIALGGSAVKTGVQFNLFKQQSQLAFSTMLGSAEKAQEFLDEMYAFAKKTPFAYPDLVQSARVMKAFGMETETIIPTLETLGDAVIATGGSSKDIEGLATVFGQISSNGKLALEDVNQLTTRGVPALQILANKSGKSVMDLREDISAGSIESQQAITDLVDGIKNGTDGVAGQTAKFGGLMGEMKGTLTGSLDSMKSAWRNAFGEMTETMSKSEGSLQQLVSNITRIFKVLPQIFGGSFESLDESLSSLADWVGKIADALENMDEKQLKAIGSMGLLAVAIGPGLIAFGKASQGLAEVVSVFEEVDAIFSSVGPVIQGLSPNFDGLGNKITGFGSKSKSVFDEFRSNTGTVFSGMGNLMEPFLVDGKQLFKAYSNMFKNFIGADLMPMKDVFKIVFDGIGADIGSVASKVANSKLGKLFTPLVNGVQQAMPALGQIGQGVQGLLGQAGGAVTGIVGQTVGALGSVMTMALSVLGPAAIGGILLAGLGLLNMSFGEQIDGMIEMVTTKGPTIIDTLTNAIQTKLPEFIQSGAELVANFGNAIVANLPALFTLATTLITTLVDGVAQSLPLLIPVAIDIVGGLVNGVISAAPQLLLSGLNLLQALIDGVVQNLPKIATTAMSIVDNLSKNLETNLPKIIEKGINILVSLINGIVKAIPQLIPIVIKLIGVIANAIMTNLPKIIEGGTKILDALINGVVKLIPQLVPMVVKIFTQILQAIVTNLPKILEAGITLLGKLASGIIQAIPALVAQLPKIFTSIVGAIRDMDWMSIGKNIIDGIAKGISNFAGSIVDAAKSAASSAFEGAKNFLGIHSPSRLFRDGVGIFIPQGIAAGIDKDADTMQSALTSAADDLTFDPSFGSVIDPSNVRMAGYSTVANQGVDGNDEIKSMLANMIDLLYALLEKDNDVYIDGQRATDILKQRISLALKEMNDQSSYNNGIVPKPI